jgi:hypothetical protein
VLRSWREVAVAPNELPFDTLTSGGGLAVAVYAALQLGKFVVAVTSFLARLEGTWKQEGEHREIETAHWGVEEKHHQVVVDLLGKIRTALETAKTGT